jgi:hypothetical protein
VRSQRTHTDLYLVIGTAALQTFKACRIWGPHGGANEQHYLLGRDTL